MATSKRERQRINREQRRAEEAKAARRVRALRLLKRSGYVAAALVAAGLLISLLQNRGGEEEAATTTTTSTTTTTTTTTTAAPEAGPSSYEEIRALPTACGGSRPTAPAELTFAEPGDGAVGDTATAVITTSCGDITIELDPAGAPETVNSFAFLAGEGYFDGTALHRIMSGFMM